MDSAELLRMDRMLEVEALSFQLQLEKAVSYFNFVDFKASLVLVTIEHPGARTLLSLFAQGFSDTSLSVGEAAAVLRNYERRTGETLSRQDLEEHRLAQKLTPEDYDLKSQVIPAPLTIPDTC